MPTDELVPTFQPAPGPAMTSDAELRRQFGVAVRWFQDRSIILPVTPTARDRLFFYGRFKQATLGDNVLPCPSIFSPLRRYMWTAWDQQRGKSREQAMREYLHRIDEEMATFDFTRLNAQQMEWRDRFVQEMDREELRRALQDNDRRGSAASPLRPARQGDGQLREQKREDNQHSALERQPLGKAAHEEEHKEPPAPPLSAVNSPSAVLPTSPLRPSGRASPTSHLSPGSTERTVASVSASLSSLTSSLAVPTSTAQKVVALQDELTSLLTLLTQRSQQGHQQWKDVEHRLHQRIDRIQQAQDDIRRKVEGEGKREEHGRAWVTGLWVVGGAAVVGYGAWWWWQRLESQRLRVIRR